MPCTEAYKEHIMYTFDGFCKTVIRFLPSSAGGWDCFNQKDYQQLLIVFSIYNMNCSRSLRLSEILRIHIKEIHRLHVLIMDESHTVPQILIQIPGQGLHIGIILCPKASARL